MLRRLLIFFLLLTQCGVLVAQEIYYPSRPLNIHINDKILFGLKGGVNLPRLYYSNKNLKKLPHDFMLCPTVSAFVEYKIYKKISMAVELNYQQRGGATSYVYEKDYNVTYKFQADYASVRLPFYWYWSNNYKFSPYLFLAPDFGYAIGGNISLSQPGLPIEYVSVAINDANINRMYIGLLGGIGIRKNVYRQNWIWTYKADAALNWGFLNTFAYSENNDTSTPTNVNAYNSQGRRASVGLEINISIGLSRDQVDTNCFPYK